MRDTEPGGAGYFADEGSMHDATQGGLRLIRKRQVLSKTGLGRSTLHEMIRAGRFPAQVPIGPKSVAFLEHEVDAWIEQRVAEARGTKAGGDHARR